MDKNEATLAFLRKCPIIQSNPLFFNFGSIKDNAHQLNAQSNDTSLQKPYIDGSVQKRYTYNVDTYKSVSFNANIEGLPDENIDDVADVQAVIDWINEQGDLEIYPDFGEGFVIDGMKTLNANPLLVSVDTSLNPAIAIYRVSIQIDYVDYTKVIWK